MYDPNADPRYDPAGRREVAPEGRWVDGRWVEAPVPVRPVGAVEPVVVEPYNVRAVQVTWFVIALIAVLIALRFTLRLLGASSQAQFVGFIYGVTAPLVAPFRGIFPDSGQGFYMFEPSALVAILVYVLIGWGLVSLIRIITAPRHAKRLL